MKPQKPMSVLEFTLSNHGSPIIDLDQQNPFDSQHDFRLLPPQPGM